jgi:hypothetical protein
MAWRGKARRGKAGHGEARQGMDFVYLIASSEHGPTKIGWSWSPVQRKGELQTGNPAQLHVFGRIQCADAQWLEQTLHVHFASRHIRGEWFDVTTQEAAEAARDYGYCSSGGDFDWVQTHRSSPFDVRPVRGGQQHPIAGRGEDVPRRGSAFDASRRQPLLDALRGKH